MSASSSVKLPEPTPEEWKHEWRPGFEADVESKNGAARVMSDLYAREASEEEMFRTVVQAAAFASYMDPSPVESSSTDMDDGEGLKCLPDVIYRLGDLPAVHASRRPALVNDLAAGLCRIVDGGSSRWRALWCRLIWQVWAGYVRGEGGLQALQAALARLDGDLREGAPWTSPGAVLAARLRGAA